MPVIIVIGGQWGDEGKGRVVDLIARKAHVVARYSGGNNAGHTVVNEFGETRLHLVPAGIFYPDKVCVIGNGVIIDPKVLLEEIDDLQSRGVSIEKLRISSRCQIIMPWHLMIDRLDEELRGKGAIGTTARGVGPCFADKVFRAGIRMADLVDPEAFRERLSFLLPYKNAVLEKLYGAEPLSFEEVYSSYTEYGAKIAPFVIETAELVQDALERGETVLLEGAQGTLLDLDAGTYEFVTSSTPSSMAAGAGIGIGIGPTRISRVVAVYKAYQTRVGNGPMPTELVGEEGDTLRERGHEYGATTGRPRRCGWFDSVASRYTARLNGLTGMVMTRLDILDQYPTLKVCTAYRLDGKVTKTFPSSNRALLRVEPIYEELPGWQKDTKQIRAFEDLPTQARAYIQRIQELVGCPIDLVSVGPEREQAVIINPII
jgi:adenylosuccinate synthase